MGSFVPHFFVKKWGWDKIYDIHFTKITKMLLRQMKTLNCLLLILFIFTGCKLNMQYPWILESSYKDILGSSDGKLILLDFETEW